MFCTLMLLLNFKHLYLYVLFVPDFLMLEPAQCIVQHDSSRGDIGHTSHEKEGDQIETG